MNETSNFIRNIIIAIVLIFSVVIFTTFGFSILQNIINNDVDEGEGDDDEIVVYKPAIYLYPLKTSEISVSLSINGEIIESDPEYNSGWKVLVNPEGNIEGGYDYLFYEAKLNYLETPAEGWCIKYELLELWMNEILKELGLNDKESQDFKDFWLNFLPKANYYEIRLLSMKYLDSNMRLEIDPLPDTIIRVFFVFSSHQNAISLDTPIITTPIRTGFTVVEWGGFFI